MWSEERTALLRKLWAEGFSASQIAKQLGGLEHCWDGGRSAVCGKIHRLHLQSRASPSRPSKRIVRDAQPPRKLCSERARNMAVTRWSSRPPKPKAEVPVRVDPTSPASLAAMALLASADAAQRRRDGYRATIR